MRLLNELKSSRFLGCLYGLTGLLSLLYLIFSLFGIGFYWNTSASNPYKLFVGTTYFNPKKDIYVIAFPDALIVKQALKNLPVIKTVKGMPGDRIQVLQDTVFLNSEGIAQIEKLDGNHTIQLSSIDEQVIPEDFYYLSSDQTHRGFDSRYAQFGLIHKENIRCQVWPIY